LDTNCSLFNFPLFECIRLYSRFRNTNPLLNREWTRIKDPIRVHSRLFVVLNV
jgi:hypothetical protein